MNPYLITTNPNLRMDLLPCDNVDTVCKVAEYTNESFPAGGLTVCFGKSKNQNAYSNQDCRIDEKFRGSVDRREHGGDSENEHNIKNA